MPDLMEWLKRLKSLGETAIEIVAIGHYKNRKQTRVQDVCVYQNNGTQWIKPAKFVESADRKNRRKWSSQIAQAVPQYVDSGNWNPLIRAGEQIARDINDAVNRIDTRRLKHSMKSSLIVDK